MVTDNILTVAALHRVPGVTIYDYDTTIHEVPLNIYTNIEVTPFNLFGGTIWSISPEIHIVEKLMCLIIVLPYLWVNLKSAI